MLATVNPNQTNPVSSKILRILLIGNAEMTERIHSLLERAGHSVVGVPDFAEATEALLVQRFDATVLTPGLPEAEIAEFTSAVRELDRRAANGRTAVLTTASNWSDGMQPPSGSGIDEIVPESIDADALTLAIARLAAAVGTDGGAASPQLAPELPVLDVEQLKEQVAFDSELLVELIDLYLSERRKQSEEMAAALAAKDWPQLSRIAHTIKGSLGSLHASAARITAQNLEYAARDGEGAKCADFLPYLERQLDELEIALLEVKRAETA